MYAVIKIYDYLLVPQTYPYMWVHEIRRPALKSVSTRTRVTRILVRKKEKSFQVLCDPVIIKL